MKKGITILWNKIKKERDLISKIKPEILIATLSFILSVYVVHLSIKQESRSIDHDKLMVMPNLDISLRERSNSSIMGLEIANNGLGPAKIIDAKIYCDTTYTKNSYDAISFFITNGLQFWIGGRSDLHYTVIVDKTIPSNQSVFLFSIDATKLNSPECCYDSCFRRMAISFKYKDIYNDSFYTTFKGAKLGLDSTLGDKLEARGYKFENW